jgi:hypothetical protein
LRFKDDYFLYAVMETGTDPKLYVIQNPAERLAAVERVESVRYLVKYEEIVRGGGQ